MRTDASSKKPKKNSDEDRTKKKKIKSSKRRRDSSLSSYSSDSEEDSRRRRKISKSKRRKESKKSEKGRGRKKRHRRYSSVSSSDSDSILSCSTCSSSDRSRSLVRQGDRRAKLSARGRSKGRKTDRERGKERSSRRRRESSDNSRYRSRSCSTCSRGSNWSDKEEKFREKSRPRRLKSVLKVSKSSEEREERYGKRNEGRDKIIKAYDDFPSSRSENENLDNKIIVKADMNSDVFGGDSLACEIGTSKGLPMRVDSEVDAGDGSKETDDLELILRQKALENFRKFRGGHSVKKESLDKEKDVIVESDSFRSLKDASESEHQMQVQGDDRPNEFSGRSPSNQFSRESVLCKPTNKNNVNSLHSHANNSSRSKTLGSLIVSGSTEVQSILNETSEQMSLDQTAVTKDTQQKEHGIIKAHGAQVDIADGSDLQASHLNKENENSKPIVSTVEPGKGSQFEQKTFSRVHDGETVQVSYKVYIPKKVPALKRRQLQR